jgi:spore maturation protein CgeB
MNLAIFGLSVSSSWGNGHATLWRGMCAALGRLGHRVTFFERDLPYYAACRDLHELPGGKLILYPDWQDVLPAARRAVAEADVAMVTSYCPDALSATALVLQSKALRVFYDLDTGVTLSRLRRGERVEYIGADGLSGFDLVLSYTGGRSLDELKLRLGARRVEPLYGHVDPLAHRPVPAEDRYRADCSYLGTYAEDRNAALNALFVEPARRLPDCRFLIGGAQYDSNFPWQPNIYFVRHVPPADHCAFYCSSPLTLNVTRRAMADIGYCPSGRLFEAAACAVPVLSDVWEGIDEFFEPESEILLARTREEAMAAIARPREELKRIADAARERVMRDHTSAIRARQLETILDAARHSAAAVEEAAH